jgi:hypothetical protein
VSGHARGRRNTLCARGAWLALLGGPSTSPLRSIGSQRALEAALCFNFDQTANAVIATYRRTHLTHSFAPLSAHFAAVVRKVSCEVGAQTAAVS